MHYDDTPPYYSIAMDDGSESSTVRERLLPILEGTRQLAMFAWSILLHPTDHSEGLVSSSELYFAAVSAAFCRHYLRMHVREGSLDLSSSNLGLIPSAVFQGCEWIRTVVIPDSVHHIGDGAFQGCVRLTSVSWDALPLASGRDACVIGDGAFMGCTALESFAMTSRGVTVGARVGARAFSGCASLSAITISIWTTIGEAAIPDHTLVQPDPPLWLQPGESCIYSHGDDGPLLVAVLEFLLGRRSDGLMCMHARLGPGREGEAELGVQPASRLFPADAELRVWSPSGSSHVRIQQTMTAAHLLGPGDEATYGDVWHYDGDRLVKVQYWGARAIGSAHVLTELLVLEHEGEEHLVHLVPAQEDYCLRVLERGCLEFLAEDLVKKQVFFYKDDSTTEVEARYLLGDGREYGKLNLKSDIGTDVLVLDPGDSDFRLARTLLPSGSVKYYEGGSGSEKHVRTVSPGGNQYNPYGGYDDTDSSAESESSTVEDVRSAEEAGLVLDLSCTGMDVLKVPSIDMPRLREATTLSLSCCESLVDLGDNLAKATSLESLNLWGCIRLRALPDTIDTIGQLRELILCDCECLHALPSSIGQCQLLQHLNLAMCIGLRSLPDSLGLCDQLAVLDLSGCSSLLELPDSLGRCSQLEELCLSCCSQLAALPVSISSCPLARLSLSNCVALASMPDLSHHESWLGPHCRGGDIPSGLREWADGGFKPWRSEVEITRVTAPQRAPPPLPTAVKLDLTDETLADPPPIPELTEEERARIKREREVDEAEQEAEQARQVRGRKAREEAETRERLAAEGIEITGVTPRPSTPPRPSHLPDGWEGWPEARQREWFYDWHQQNPGLRMCPRCHAITAIQWAKGAPRRGTSILSCNQKACMVCTKAFCLTCAMPMEKGRYHKGCGQFPPWSVELKEAGAPFDDQRYQQPPPLLRREPCAAMGAGPSSSGNESIADVGLAAAAEASPCDAGGGSQGNDVAMRQAADEAETEAEQADSTDDGEGDAGSPAAGGSSRGASAVSTHDGDPSSSAAPEAEAHTQPLPLAAPISVLVLSDRLASLLEQASPLHPHSRLCIATSATLCGNWRSGETPRHSCTGSNDYESIHAQDVSLDEYDAARLKLAGYLPMTVSQLRHVDPAAVQTLLVNIDWRSCGGWLDGEEASNFDDRLDIEEDLYSSFKDDRQRARRDRRELRREFRQFFKHRTAHHNEAAQFLDLVLQRGLLSRFTGLRCLRFPLDCMGFFKPGRVEKWLVAFAQELVSFPCLQTLDLGDFTSSRSQSLPLRNLPRLLPGVLNLPPLSSIATPYATAASWPDSFRNRVAVLSLTASSPGTCSAPSVGAMFDWMPAQLSNIGSLFPSLQRLRVELRCQNLRGLGELMKGLPASLLALYVVAPDLWGVGPEPYGMWERKLSAHDIDESLHSFLKPLRKLTRLNELVVASACIRSLARLDRDSEALGVAGSLASMLPNANVCVLDGSDLMRRGSQIGFDVNFHAIADGCEWPYGGLRPLHRVLLPGHLEAWHYLAVSASVGSLNWTEPQCRDVSPPLLCGPLRDGQGQDEMLAELEAARTILDDIANGGDGSDGSSSSRSNCSSDDDSDDADGPDSNCEGEGEEVASSKSKSESGDEGEAFE